MSNFERSNFLNTKFLIKVTPSDKIKQFLSSKRKTTENYENRNAVTTSVSQGREYKLNK